MGVRMDCLELLNYSDNKWEVGSEKGRVKGASRASTPVGLKISGKEKEGISIPYQS